MLNGVLELTIQRELCRIMFVLMLGFYQTFLKCLSLIYVYMLNALMLCYFNVSIIKAFRK